MRAVIFDFDGVLVNSEPVHYLALRDALASEGLRIDEDEYAQHYLAYPDREAIRLALERHGHAYDKERVTAVALRKAERFESLQREVPMCPGARELVQSLHAEVPLAIASGARRAEIESQLHAAGLRDRFRCVVGAEDVRYGKPDPEPYLTALRGLRAELPELQAGDCVVIEDSMAGIAAGLAAGMRVVGVAHTYPAARLTAATCVIESLQGLHAISLRALMDRT